MTFVENFNDKSLPKLLQSLGEELLITPVSGTAYNLQAFFDTNYESINEYGQVVTTNKPRIVYKTADAVSLKRGDTVSFEGSDFIVENVEKEDVLVSVAYLHNKNGS